MGGLFKLKQKSERGNFFWSKLNKNRWLIFFFGLSQNLCVWKEILMKDLSYKNLDIYNVFDLSQLNKSSRCSFF